MENYFKIKSTLFNLLNEKNGKAVINYDDDYGRKLASKLHCNIALFSKNDSTRSFFSQLNDYKNKIDGVISSNKGSYRIESSLIGSYNLENILAAVTTLDLLKISESAITQGIKICKNVPGRLESFLVKTGAKVIIDYAHTPDAYNKILSTLKSVLTENNNLYLVFGAGGNRDIEKRQIHENLELRSLQSKVLINIEKRIKTPPIVGVPSLVKCDCGPSLLTFCLI